MGGTVSGGGGSFGSPVAGGGFNFAGVAFVGYRGHEATARVVVPRDRELEQ